MTQLPSPADVVSMHRCPMCSRYVIYDRGNHHPWCLRCMWDQLDWNDGRDNITRADAERIKAGDEQ